ncbi:hypothetical protein VULLAG_LOCUS12877 [Vulpes lagopus]
MLAFPRFSEALEQSASDRGTPVIPRSRRRGRGQPRHVWDAHERSPLEIREFLVTASNKRFRGECPRPPGIERAPQRPAVTAADANAQASERRSASRRCSQAVASHLPRRCRGPTLLRLLAGCRESCPASRSNSSPRAGGQAVRLRGPRGRRSPQPPPRAPGPLTRRPAGTGAAPRRRRPPRPSGWRKRRGPSAPPGHWLRAARSARYPAGGWD